MKNRNLISFLIQSSLLVLFLSIALADNLSGSVVGPLYVFDDPAVEDISTRFQEIHNSTEDFYSGNGSWYGDLSSGQWSGRAALGYMAAYKATDITVFADRSKEALEFLIGNQEVNGFWADSGHDTGVAGAAMVEGYKVFGNTEYFQSSKRAADVETTLIQGECKGELTNCAFMIWHLANHYEITGDAKYLNKAIEMAQYVIDQQDQNVGNWPSDHSGEFSYHVAYLRGLTELVRVIPTDHQSEKELIESTVRALNYTISMQHQSGNFYQDLGKTTLAAAGSGAHPRTSEALNIFINELGLTKVQDVMDGLTLYTMSLDLGALGVDEELMLLYSTGVALESYGGVIIDLYFDPSMVTTTTVPESGGPADGGPPGPAAPEEQPDVTTTATTATTPTTPQTNDTSGATPDKEKEIAHTADVPLNIIEDAIETTKKIMRERPVGMTLALIAIALIIVTIIHKSQATKHRLI